MTQILCFQKTFHFVLWGFHMTWEAPEFTVLIAQVCSLQCKVVLDTLNIASSPSLFKLAYLSKLFSYQNIEMQTGVRFIDA